MAKSLPQLNVCLPCSLVCLCVCCSHFLMIPQVSECVCVCVHLKISNLFGAFFYKYIANIYLYLTLIGIYSAPFLSFTLFCPGLCCWVWPLTRMVGQLMMCHYLICTYCDCSLIHSLTNWCSLAKIPVFYYIYYSLQVWIFVGNWLSFVLIMLVF